LLELHRQHQVRLQRTYRDLGGLQVMELPPGADVCRVAEAYRASGLVRMAEPDYVVRAVGVPDDPRFTDGTQWNLHNTGQGGGLVDADIDAPEAWDRRSMATNVVVAVVDSGIWRTHEDLAVNLWVNPNEVAGNEVDDDGNDFIDDVHGINAAEGDGRVGDVAGHGTHAAGILGAVGNNGRGIAGVAWGVQIMVCRFLASDGSGSISDAITCLEYARAKGAHVVNASWVGTDYSEALELAVARLRDAGIIFVAAAGNDGADNDRVPYYPPSLPLDNVVAVAATTDQDGLLNLPYPNPRSNYGAEQVDLGAPGLGIYSAFFIADNNYLTMSGTSQAAPHVAGAVALVRAAYPQASYREVIDRILVGVDPLPALEGKCRTGGRLNLAQALDPGPLTVSPRSLRTVLGSVGGPFQSTAKSFTLANRGAAPLGWSVHATQAWLSVSSGQGTIEVGASTRVGVTLNDAAFTLSPGVYTNVLQFVDHTAGTATTEVPWVLRVYAPARLALRRSSDAGGGVQVDLSGEAGATYYTEATTDLAGWRVVTTNTLPESGSAPGVLVDPGTQPQRFFRARRAP
jgi:subtilisin family serine protease